MAVLVNYQMYDSRVTFMNWKWKQPPNCLVTTHVTFKLEFHHLIVCIWSGNAKHRHVTPFVHIFTNIFYRFHGVSVLNIAVGWERFRQKWTMWNDPAIIVNDIVSIHFYLDLLLRKNDANIIISVDSTDFVSYQQSEKTLCAVYFFHGRWVWVVGSTRAMSHVRCHNGMPLRISFSIWYFDKNYRINMIWSSLVEHPKQNVFTR